MIVRGSTAMSSNVITLYEYRDEVRVGAVLPDAGVTYYEVPPEYSRARDYRYTIVNGHTVLVDPRTHTIVQIVDCHRHNSEKPPFGAASVLSARRAGT